MFTYAIAVLFLQLSTQIFSHSFSFLYNFRSFLSEQNICDIEMRLGIAVGIVKAARLSLLFYKEKKKKNGRDKLKIYNMNFD